MVFLNAACIAPLIVACSSTHCTLTSTVQYKYTWSCWYYCTILHRFWSDVASFRSIPYYSTVLLLSTVLYFYRTYTILCRHLFSRRKVHVPCTQLFDKLLKIERERPLLDCFYSIGLTLTTLTTNYCTVMSSKNNHIPISYVLLNYTCLFNQKAIPHSFQIGIGSLPFILGTSHSTNHHLPINDCSTKENNGVIRTKSQS